MTKQDKKDFAFIINLLNEYRHSFCASTVYLKSEVEDAKDDIKISKIINRIKPKKNI